MWKKIAVSGAVAAAVLGSGAVALAASSSNNTANAERQVAPAAESHPVLADKLKANKAKANKIKHLADGRAGLGGKNFEHGEFVTRDGGKDVTHDVIHGSVTAVSATSIAVKASDGVTMTFAVNGDTVVRARDGDKTADSITQIKTGDDVIVAGVKSGSSLTARHVVKTKK